VPISQNPGETSLVIAGAWNPAILTPAWVLHHGLGRPGSDEPVQIAVPASTNAMIDFPRFTLAEFAYVVRPDTLIMLPPQNSPESFASLEAAAASMLENLAHTPVSGVGHNFEFREPQPAAEKLAVFTRASQDIADEAPEGWTSVSTFISSSFRFANGSTVANVQRLFDGSNIVIKFNFHHPLSTVEEALHVLRGLNGKDRMQANFETARNLIKSIYGEEQ
jgi:hypothetical protein